MFKEICGDENLELITNKVAELNKKAVKLNLNKLELHIVKTRFVQELTRVYKYYLVHLVGAYPRINGWSFVAEIEHLKTGNIINTFEELPDSYRDSKPVCEHCSTKRLRKYTYIIKSEEGYKQVGRSCLTDFVGSENILGVLDIVKEINNLTNNQEYTSSTSTKEYYNREDWLYTVVEHLKTNPWISSTKAKEEGLTPTWKKSLDEYPKYRHTMEKDKLEYVNAILEYVQCSPLDSNYMENLYVVLKQEYIELKHLPIVASAVVVYKAHLKKEEERIKMLEYVKNIPNKVLGKIGERIQLTATVIDKRSFWNGFGTTNYLRIKTPDGYLLSTYTTSEGTSLIEVGSKISFKATIKEITDTNEVVVTRLKLTN